jgi:drug/metabolite transporter (DMT)-like permease
MPDNLLGLIFGLSSALIWGGGDFSGGLATRKLNAFQALAITSLIGLAAMLALALLTGETWPVGIDFLWAGLAGLIGALGIATLYKGLSMRAAAIVAPTSAVVGTAIPVLVTFLIQGLPGPTQSAGILLGAAGIWLVSRSPGSVQAESRRAFGLAIASGLCFGSFFTLIAQVHGDNIFAPLAISKASATLVALLILPALRLPLPGLRANPLGILAGLMDSGGNVFYLLAVRYTRIDIAAILASMAPAITVLLSAVFLRERVTRSQVIGVLICVVATVLLAL